MHKRRLLEHSPYGNKKKVYFYSGQCIGNSLITSNTELQQRISVENNKWRDTIVRIRQEIDRKEKEIERLSFLAEQDKKSGMFLRQQILRKYCGCSFDLESLLICIELKKSLEGFLQAREDNKPETLCSVSPRNSLCLIY